MMFFRETIRRGVAPIGRAPDSKSGCWEFESLHPCHYLKPQSKDWGFFYCTYLASSLAVKENAPFIFSEAVDKVMFIADMIAS